MFHCQPKVSKVQQNEIFQGTVKEVARPKNLVLPADQGVHLKEAALGVVVRTQTNVDLRNHRSRDLIQS